MELESKKIQQILTRPTDSSNNPPLYTILDGAADPDIYPLIKGSFSECKCLYFGTLPEELVSVAPYLIRLTHDSPFTKKLFKEGWGKSWGIYFTASEDVDNLARHFRKFLTVRDHRERALFFRYYDPVVLQVFLPTCTEEQLKNFFGPVKRFQVEKQDEPETIIEFRYIDNELETEEISIPQYD